MTRRRWPRWCAHLLIAAQLLHAGTGYTTAVSSGPLKAPTSRLFSINGAPGGSYQLTPGVALSAQQMASLTTDIVWLEAQTVSLPDGSTTEALVPRVYLRRPVAGDLTPTGSLISASSIDLRNPGGDISNSGTLYGWGQGGVNVQANNIANTGTIAGNRVNLAAQRDITLVGGQVIGTGNNSTATLGAGGNIILQTTTQTSSQSLPGANGATQVSRTHVDRVATVAADTITLAALGNISLTGASVKATGNLGLSATGAITAHAVQESYTLNVPMGGAGGTTQGRTGHYQMASTTSVGTQISAGGNALLSAGGDASFTGSIVSAGNNLAVLATNVTVQAAKDSLSIDQQGVHKSGYERVGKADETLSGGVLTAGNDLSVIAKGDITLNAANLVSGTDNKTTTTGQLSLIAVGNIDVAAVTTSHSTFGEAWSRRSGAFSSSLRQRDSTSQSSIAEGSLVSGTSVVMQAGQVGADGRLAQGKGNIAVTGSDIVADHNIDIRAGNNVAITAATHSESSSLKVISKDSGFGAVGDLSYGTSALSYTGSSSSTTAAASQVGSLQGDVSITAGNAYSQTGSDVLAVKGDIAIQGRSVQITEARESGASQDAQSIRQSGITLDVSNPLLDAGRTVGQLAGAAGKTRDSRSQALAAAAVAATVYNTASQVAADPASAASVGINLSLVSNKIDDKSQSQSATGRGATVAAGDNLSITATGAGADSTLQVRGSDVSAGNDASLKADGQIVIAAAQDTGSATSSHSSRSSSVGIGFNVGAGGVGITVNASASRASGDTSGADSQWVNSHITAGNQLVLQSGGDTRLRGGVVTGDSVKATVGGNLVIESLQDASTYRQDNKNSGFSASVAIFGVGGGASVSAGKSHIDSQFASVGEQSAIRAGDGGFQVDVKGDTHLKGGAITSTDKAVADGVNSFTTAGTLSTSDIHNSARYDAKGWGGTIGVGSMAGSTRVGIGSDKGSASSTTASAISAIAGDKGARTGDKESGIKPIFDATRVADDINAQITITGAFGQSASKAVGNYAQAQLDEAARLRTQAGSETDPARKAQLDAQARALEAAWAEGGTMRTAAHAVIGALTGGAGGAAGAAASQLSIPEIGNWIRDTNLPTPVKQALIESMGAAIGAAVGGTAGAAGALNAVANNYLSHNRLNTRNSQLVAFSRDLATCQNTAGCNPDTVYARWSELSRTQQGDVQNALAQGLDSGDFTRFGQVVAGAAGAVGANPADYCQAGDARCASFIMEQNRQATSVLTTAVMLGAVEDVTGRPARPGNVSPNGRTVKPGSGGNGPVIGDLNADGTVTIRPATGNQLTTAGANGGTGSVIAADAAGGAKNPLLADAMPRNGDRLVLNQGNVPTCGANSCGMALDTMGRPVDVATLIQRIPPTAEGIYSTDVAILMKSQGVDAIALDRRNVSDLARYTENGTPVVVRVADPGVSDFSHFVVVDGVTTRNGVQVVAIRDPQGAQYFSPVTTFNKSFTGEVIVPKPATTPVPSRK